MSEIELSFADFISLRRKLRLIYNGKISTTHQLKGFGHLFSFNDQGIKYFSQVLFGSPEEASADAITEYCNKPDCPSGKTPASHNFSDSATWTQKSGKNIYTWTPSAGKEWWVTHIDGKMDYSASFGANQSFVLAVWKGIYAPCPSQPVSTPTICTGLEADGWVDVTSADEQDQFFTEYWNFGANAAAAAAQLAAQQPLTYPPLYACKKYEYDSFNKMLVKAVYEAVGTQFYKIEFPFASAFIELVLSANMNDRIEAYFDDNGTYETAVSSPNSIYQYVKVNGGQFNIW